MSNENRFRLRVALIVLMLGINVMTWVSAKSTTTQSKADRVVIVKSDHTLTLMSGGKILKIYKVALGRGGSAAKNQMGDRETPEGDYVIDAKNAHSRFHRSLHISYPNARDRERARKLGTNPGGQIEIHGVEEKWAWVGSLHRAVDWTAGCIAVTNPEIEEIYKLVPIGTPVEIRATEQPVKPADTINPNIGDLHMTIPLVATAKPRH